jgi:tetratricopeptide (TPR) repeat protein
MAGLVAARHGLATLLSLGRLDLALELACWERDRLARLAGHRDVNDSCYSTSSPAPRSAAASSVRARALIDEERAALPYERGVERDALAEALEDGLPAQAEAGAPQFGGLQPDIVGETFCLLVLATNPDLDQAALVDRCRERAPARTAQHLVLTVQDFARPAAELTTGTLPARRPEARLLPGWLGEDGPALAWLDHLVAGTDDLVRLMAIADQMPEHTLLLRERAMLISHRIADVLRPFARIAADDEIGAVLASTLNNLANGLSELGRREAALAAAEEAAALYRGLAAAQPDAFLPDLAMRLNNLATGLSELGRREAALAAGEEAVALYRGWRRRGPTRSDRTWP